MASIETKLRALLKLAQQVLDDVPLGLLVLSAHGRPMWFNREAELVCAVWNQVPLRGDALPLKRSKFAVPPVLWAACQALAADDLAKQLPPEPCVVSEPERGLHALIRLQPRSRRDGPPAFFLKLDYRRPRGDRDRQLSPAALSLLNQLSFREREVALRMRDGLTTVEIARELRRSPLTVKTQLAQIFAKLAARNRAHLVAMLNR